MHKDLYYESRGTGMIRACRWEPKQAPRGIVQIIHGIADYSERYDDFAEYLTNMGFLVVSEDHMGHGLSAKEGDLRGYFTGGWFAAVDDTYGLFELTKNEYPDLPYILFGHSMGSFMLQTILQRYPQIDVTACILCGSGWQPEIALNSGIRLCNAACRIYGETNPSPRLLKIVFGAYNLKVEYPRTPYDWVCRSSRVVDDLIADPLCSHSISTGLMRDMLQGIASIQQPANIEKINKSMPYLLVSGGDDPVGSYGEGVRKIEEKLLLAGIRNVKTRIYPLCRHEVLNELNKADVYTDIVKWIISVIT